MPVCSTVSNGCRPKTPSHLGEEEFNRIISASARVPDYRILKCVNEVNVEANSDSIVDIRRSRKKYKRSFNKTGKPDHFKEMALAKMSTDDSFEGNNTARTSKLSMNDLLHDLNRIRRVSVASSDILGDNLNRIKNGNRNGMPGKIERNRRKSTNSFSLEAKHNAEMKSIILDPETSLHSPRQQDYLLPQGKSFINNREVKTTLTGTITLQK